MAAASSPSAALRAAATASAMALASASPTLPGFSLDQLLDAVGEAVGLVAQVDQLALLLVLVGVGLGVAHHLLDLVLGEARGGGDGDAPAPCRWRGPWPTTLRMPLASMSKVDLDLRDAARGGGDAHQVELAEGAVVPGHRALPLQDVDLDGGLAVGRGREDLGLLGRDGGVSRDEPGHDAAQRLDAEREGGDVEEEHVLHLAGEDARLDGGSDGDDLVGVDALVGLLAEELLDDLLDLRACGSCRRRARSRRCPWARGRRP